MIHPKVPVKNKCDADSSNGSLSSSWGFVLLNSRYRPLRMQIVAWNTSSTNLRETHAKMAMDGGET